MDPSPIFNAAAVAALVPVAFAPLRPTAKRDLLFWALLVPAAFVPSAWAWRLLAGEWNEALGAALWVGIAASMTVFFVVALLDRQAWRLSALLAPYLVLLALPASFLPGEAGNGGGGGAPPVLMVLHIIVSVVAIGLLTPAAVAATSSLLQNRALKKKRPTAMTRALPSLADSDRLTDRLLAASEVVLGFGLISGLMTEYLQSGSLFVFSHKALFSLIAFVAIGLVLVGRRVCGVRGQMAARVILLAYLFLIAGFFGMKFVHQVLLA